MEKINRLSSFLRLENKQETPQKKHYSRIKILEQDTVSFIGGAGNAASIERNRLIELIEGLNIDNIAKTLANLANKVIKPAIPVNGNFKNLCAKVFGDIPYTTRIKKLESIIPKIKARLSVKELTLEKAMKKVTDLQGGMGITDGTPEASNEYVKRLIQALNDGDIRTITSVRNYQGPQTPPYLTPKNIMQIQEAQKKYGVPVEKIKDGESAYTKNGYPGAHITGITREGLPFEFQIKGKYATILDPATHIIHDLEVGKGSTSNFASANGRRLMQPVISAYKSLNQRQYKDYNEYIRRCYCIARDCELTGTEFFIPPMPKIIPQELSIENLNKVAELIRACLVKT